MCNTFRYRVFDPGTCTYFDLNGDWVPEAKKATVFEASSKDKATKWVGEWVTTTHPLPKILVLIQEDAESSKSSFRRALECLEGSLPPTFRSAVKQITELPHLSRCVSRRAGRRCNCGKDKRDAEINDFLTA